LLNERGVKPRSSDRWWPSSVNGVVHYRGPRPRKGSKGVRAGGSEFTLSRVLRCPTCGTRLTGSRDPHWGDATVRYACRLGSTVPHSRASISEHLILPAIRDEAAHLVTPGSIERSGVDDAERHSLDQKRSRIIDMFADGTIDKAERTRRLEQVD